MQFSWRPGEPPPELEEHSRAKLDVLRRYLRAYFDTLAADPRRDSFKLDLIDGFAGGGVFLDDGIVVSGTPLIMLEECEAARDRLNRDRIKPLSCDFKLHFVDVESDHTTYLRQTLATRGYQIDGERLAVTTSRFEDVADEIIAGIRRRQPISGRAIFLLDQKGYSQVELELVARILSTLPNAEVILTFASDALVNHIPRNPQLVKAVEPLGLTEQQLIEMIKFRDGDGGRALGQRVMRNHIREMTGATYDTPFYIRPRQSRRALWFLHLSRHPTARDVMIQCHWNSFNAFEHYGSGGFDMLGWDALKSGALPLFHFEELDAKEMREQLLNAMPSELYKLMTSGSVSVERVRHSFANRTAARFSDLDDVVLTLVRGKEIDILNSGGKLRSREVTRLRGNDRIAIPKMSLLPGISHRQHFLPWN